MLDSCMTADSKRKVACEPTTNDNMANVAGEITPQTKIGYTQAVRGVVAMIGFDPNMDCIKGFE